MLYATAAAPTNEHGDVGVYVVNAPKQSTKLCFLMYWRSYIYIDAKSRKSLFCSFHFRNLRLLKLVPDLKSRLTKRSAIFCALKVVFYLRGQSGLRVRILAAQGCSHPVQLCHPFEIAPFWHWEKWPMAVVVVSESEANQSFFLLAANLLSSFLCSLNLRPYFYSTELLLATKFSISSFSSGSSPPPTISFFLLQAVMNCQK